MNRFRVVIVEDEPLARGLLSELLARDRQLELVGEAGDGKAGLALIRGRRPDIALLDVEMPECGGVELAQRLTPDERPAIVFVTAYSDFATDAFDVAALDYVVKPFSDERFAQALERAKRRVREQRLSGLAESVAAEAEKLRGEPAAGGSGADSEYLEVIPIKRDGRSLLVRAHELVWIESQDYYSRLHTRRAAYLLRASLTSFEERLDPGRFLRVHRGAIVQLDQVLEVEHPGASRRTLVLSNGDRCRVSRARWRSVERALLPRLG